MTQRPASGSAKGELNVPPPTFSITFKAEDGTVLVWDREARKWVPLKR